MVARTRPQLPMTAQRFPAWNAGNRQRCDGAWPPRFQAAAGTLALASLGFAVGLAELCARTGLDA